VVKETHGSRVPDDTVNAGLAELLSEHGLAQTQKAAEPDDRRFLPRGFDSVKPTGAVNHASAVCVWSDCL
jgi:hypothetical protein